MEATVNLPVKGVKTQADIREALEKKVLTYTAASIYEALPKLLIAERGISFTQLPPKKFIYDDPAANSCILIIDYEPENPAPEKGNYLISDSKKDYTQLFDLLYDLTNMVVIKLTISNGSLRSEQRITKYLVVAARATMAEFCFEITALLKIMQGGVVDEKYNSFALILKSNHNNYYKKLAGDCKPRVIKIFDQTTDEEKIKQGTTEAIIKGKDMTKESLKKEYLNQYNHQQLQLCRTVSILEPFIIPELEHMIDMEQTVLSFLLKQQNQTMTTENPVLFDFKAPLEFEIILLQDAQTKHSLEHDFVLSNGAKFRQKVQINTVVSTPRKRFGIEQDYIDNFINRMMEIEVEGRRFRTKYQITMNTGSPKAENFLWTILGNKEAKEAGQRFRHFKPTAIHWQKFAEMATKEGVFNHIIELAYVQTLWQLVNTLAVSKVYKSTHQAKENSVMTLVYINVIRLSLQLMLDHQDKQLLSLDFMDKMAAIQDRTDDEMLEFIRNEFVPTLKDKNKVVDSIPKYKASIQPLVQLFAFLYYIQKDRHVHLTNKMHSLFCNKLADKSFQDGIHKLILSILAALMTQSDQAIRMYPVLTGLGGVTDQLVKIFKWDEKIVQTMKQEIKAKNGNLQDRGLIKEFFKFPENFRPSDYQRSNRKMAMRNGRYFKLVVAQLARVTLPEEFWKGQVTEAEVQLVKKIFNPDDSDVAIIASELGDLHLTSLGTSEVSKFDQTHFSNPVSHFSDLECFKRAEQNIEDDPDLRQKLDDMEKMLQSSNNWTDQQLSNQFHLPNMTLFRFETEACLEYDWKRQTFCEEPVRKGTNRCLKHAKDGTDLKMIREMGSLVSTKGISIAKGVIRVQIGPVVLDKIVEYAPSLEGAAPAFRHSLDNLEKVLEASYVTFKGGYLMKLYQFEAKEFKQRFPNAKSISIERWKHAFLAMHEIMKTYALDLESNWTRNIPFLMAKLGIYQGWLNADDIIDQKKLVSSRYDYKPIGTIADLLKDTSKRAKPIAPALIYDAKRMDGTATPSTQSSDKDGKCCKLDTDNQTFTQALQKENIYNLRNCPFSPFNAPNMGEANNLTPSLYIEPDPDHVTEFVAAVYIGHESFHNNCVQRAANIRGTRFESKNDPAWHYKDVEQFEVLRMVKNDVIQSPIQSLDELQLSDATFAPLTQAWLDRKMQYLNGQIPIGNLSSKNTHMKSQQNQRKYTQNENLEGSRDAHRQAMFHLGLLDKTMLHKIQMANYLQRFGVALFFVSTGTGPLSVDMRKLVALQAPIPRALFTDIERFRDIQDYFDLFAVKKEKPTYMDYLNVNANIFHLTFKPQQGRSQFHRPGPRMEQPGSEFSEEERNGFEFRSEIVDICSNVADLTIFRNDPYVPMVNYLVALEGNIQMVSAWCHIGNSIPEYFTRPKFSVKGDKLFFPASGPKEGAAKTVTVGSIKVGAVLRPDCRLGVAKIIQDLEVDNEDQNPIKRMRYPVENGELYQEKIRDRRNRLMEFLECEYDEADEIAEVEFAHLMATTSELVSVEDPGNSRFVLGQHNCTNEDFIRESIQFYQNCDTALVKVVPMKTFQKLRYGSGVNLDLIKKSEKPELKDFWTINTSRLTNIASQLNLKGCYNAEEEFLELQKEKSMFKCAHEFGVMANVQMENFDFIETAVRTSRPSIARTSQESDELVLRSDVASTTHAKAQKFKIKLRPMKNENIIQKEQEVDTASILDELVGEATKMSEFQNVNIPHVDYAQLNQRLRCATTDEQVDDILGTPAGALGTGSIVSLIPDRKKKMTRAPTRRGTDSTSSSSRQWYNPGSRVDLNTSSETTVMPPARQKALFKGRYFPSFGILCSPLAGTEIFPISPKMEKLHFAVAADMPVDHFDGEPQQQYLDDIKEYMQPIFASYQLSNRAKYLHRYKNPNFNEEWATKFPYASHRFKEGNAIRGKVGAEEVFRVTLESNPNLMDEYQENLNPANLGDRHGKGSKLRHEQLQVSISTQAQQTEARQVAFTAGQMREQSSDSLMSSDVLGRRFEKFLSLTKAFFIKGHKTVTFHAQVPMLDLHSLTTYEEFEDWIFQVKDQNEFPNATHEKCLLMEPWTEQFSNTQRLKIGDWLGTLLKFDRIKLIKRKIRKWAVSYHYPMVISQPKQWHEYFITLALLTED